MSSIRTAPDLLRRVTRSRVGGKEGDSNSFIKATTTLTPTIRSESDSESHEREG